MIYRILAIAAIVMVMLISVLIIVSMSIFISWLFHKLFYLLINNKKMNQTIVKGTLLSLAAFLAPLGMQLLWNSDVANWVGIVVLCLAVFCAFAREVLKKHLK